MYYFYVISSIVVGISQQLFLHNNLQKITKCEYVLLS